VAGYDCSRLLDEVDTLHVKRIQLSGLLLYRYYRLVPSYIKLTHSWWHVVLISKVINKVSEDNPISKLIIRLEVAMVQKPWYVKKPGRL
jgi:hypothetical protein